MGTENESDTTTTTTIEEPDEQDSKKSENADEKRFSQTDLDRLINERLRRERESKKDYNDLKAKAAKLDEMEAQNKSEAEKAAEREREASEKATKAIQKARDKALQAAIAKACSTANVADIEAVEALIMRSGVEFDDDDEPVGIDDAVKDLVKRKPYLKGSRFEGNADQGIKNPKGDKNDPDYLGKLSMEDYIRVRRGS